MSGVGVSGLIANLPGTITPYPTQDPSLELGGFRSDVATVADRNLIPANFRKEGMEAYVRSTKCIYALQSDLTTWKIIGNVNLGAQAAWFINPDNSTGLASDSNDGLTALTPILTWQEFQGRCFPNAARLMLKQNTAITVLAATAQTLPNVFMNFGSEPPNGALIVTVVFSITSSAAITLSAVTKANCVTDVRAQLSTAAGTFVNQERIRVTSGVALGAVCYSMGLNGGPTSTYICNPGIDETTTSTYPAIGDTVVVDTLLFQIGRLEVWAGALIRVLISDVKVTRAYLYGVDLAPYTGAGGGIFMKGCVATSTGGQWVAPFGATYINCRVPSTGKTGFSGQAQLFVNQTVQGLMAFGWGTAVVYGLWVSNGNVYFGATDNFTHGGMSASPKVWIAPPAIISPSPGAVQVENGPGIVGAGVPALSFFPGSIVQSDSFQAQMWGVSGGYPVAFRFSALAWLWFSADPDISAPLTFMKIAATVAIRASNVDLPYSANPAVFKTLGCGIVLDGGPLTENYVNRTALVAAVGVTSLLAALNARKGTFRAWGYLAPTVAGAAGNLTLNAVYTDESGATITQPICSINNTVLSGAGGSIEIECNGTTAISYSITGYTAGLTYNVRVALQYDGAGL